MKQKKRKNSEESEKQKKTERLTPREWAEIMGTNRDRYERRRGAMRRK